MSLAKRKIARRSDFGKDSTRLIPRLKIEGLRHQGSIKGSISFDTSKKGDGIRGIKRHASWRAVVTYDGKRYRKRSTDRGDCERFLVELANVQDKKEKQRRLEEELANFELLP